MPYQPIENYGIIGNMRTAALVGLNGSIDWLCLPRFDSPSVFGAILDDRIGGRFQIAPTLEEGVRHKQYYWPETNVLVTRFLHPEGIGEIDDFMPVGGAGGTAADQLVRRVRVVRGKMRFRLVCKPAFDYARAEHQISLNKHGARFDGPDLSIGLASSWPMSQDENGVESEFTLGEGQDATFVLRILTDSGDCGQTVGTSEAAQRFRDTVSYWRRWASKCNYSGRWRETVLRSALALKLMTYEPTGAIVAAPTTSLPEGIGGVRNWDYRFTWIRDAAFTVYAFLRLGFTEEATAFMGWLSHRWEEHESHTTGPLQLMYGIDGNSDLPEFDLPHLEGYKKSAPVRVGNGCTRNSSWTFTAS